MQTTMEALAPTTLDSQARHHSKAWLCLSCSSPTVNPKILRSRHGKWLVATACLNCGQINLHSKYSNWIVSNGQKIETPAATGVGKGVLEMKINDTT